MKLFAVVLVSVVCYQALAMPTESDKHKHSDSPKVSTFPSVGPKHSESGKMSSAGSKSSHHLESTKMSGLGSKSSKHSESGKMSSAGSKSSKHSESGKMSGFGSKTSHHSDHSHAPSSHHSDHSHASSSKHSGKSHGQSSQHLSKSQMSSLGKTPSIKPSTASSGLSLARPSGVSRSLGRQSGIPSGRQSGSQTPHICNGQMVANVVPMIMIPAVLPVQQIQPMLNCCNQGSSSKGCSIHGSQARSQTSGQSYAPSGSYFPSGASSTKKFTNSNSKP